MDDQWLHALGLAGGLLLLPALCTALLGWAGFPRPGRALVGGMIAGFLLGPGVFGRAFPTEYEANVVGGVPQRLARDKTVSRHHADFLVAQKSGWNLDQLANLQNRQSEELKEFEQACDVAQSHHQRPRRAFALALASLTLLIAGAFSIPRSAHRQSIIAPISIGLWSAALPGALTYAAASVWWKLSPIESAWAAAAIAIGPWALNAIDREAADDAELGGAFLIQTAGRIASVLAVALALVAAWFATNGHQMWPALCLLSLPLGWLPFVSWPIRAGLTALRSAQTDSWFVSLVFSSLAACTAITIDPLADFS
ncbi:MAG: hypothetical protein L0219_06175, partial [Phycisphaerales bacterium]|nr:hypothetical protein [Phycisphaerales bacterium]